jgi:hypothetical protein
LAWCRDKFTFMFYQLLETSYASILRVDMVVAV